MRLHSPDAYKNADGRKIENRRVVVDVERGRTVPNWRPRRLGGGLGGTRLGGKEVNQLVSGREVRMLPQAPELATPCGSGPFCHIAMGLAEPLPAAAEHCCRLAFGPSARSGRAGQAWSRPPARARALSGALPSLDPLWRISGPI